MPGIYRFKLKTGAHIFLLYLLLNSRFMASFTIGY